MVPTLVLTFLGVLDGMIRYVYSLKAEQFYDVPKFYFYDNKGGQKNSIKPKTKKDKIVVAFSVVGIVIIIMTIVVMYNSTHFSPEEKEKYEIFEEMNTECKVVVGYYKYLAIFMDDKINRSNKGSCLEIVREDIALNQLKI